MGTEGDRVLLVGFYFPKADKGRCQELLGDLFDEDTFDDGIPMPSGISYDFGDATQESKKDDDDEDDSDQWDIVHTSGFNVSVHIAQIVFGIVILIIAIFVVLIYVKGKEFVIGLMHKKVQELTRMVEEKASDTIDRAREMIGGRMH